MRHMTSLTGTTRQAWIPGALLLFASVALAPTRATAADNTFERTFTVSGAVRLELNNGSGNVEIRGSADGKVHIVGKVTQGWSVFGGSEKNVQEVLANPPVEQHDNVVRIGRSNSMFRNVSIDYKIEVPARYGHRCQRGFGRHDHRHCSRAGQSFFRFRLSSRLQRGEATRKCRRPAAASTFPGSAES